MNTERPWRLVAVFSPYALEAMKGNIGKLAAQAGHAYLHTFWDAEKRFPDRARAYRESAFAVKIALRAPDDAWLNQWFDEYKERLPMTKVVDAGFTCFDGPTLTCVGMGPLRTDEYPDALRCLPLLKGF